MKSAIDISDPQVWKSIFTPEEYKKLEYIIESMQCDPKPTPMEFLTTIRAALEDGLITDPRGVA